MNAWPKWIVGAALAVVSALLGLIYGLYWYGATALPSQLPLPTRTYSDQLRAEYWASLGGRGPLAAERLNPLKFCWNLYRMRVPSPPEEQLLVPMSRFIANQAEAHHRGMAHWHLNSIAAAIRLSQERSAEQIADLTLEHAWMGRNATGMHEGAIAYFGVPLEQLTQAERISLIALMHGPSLYDPNRNPDRFRKRYALIAKNLGMPSSRIDPERDLARLILTPPTTSPTEHGP